MTIKELMKILGITEEEVKKMLESDKQVDKMTKMSEINADLSQEQQKTVKKLKNVGEKVVKTTRNKPQDTEKIDIIEKLAVFLKNIGQSDVIIKNSNREITFNVGDNHYSLVLTKHNRVP